MHEVERYIDSLFIDLPNTEQNEYIRQVTKENYVGRYNALLVEGMSESAALATVIIEIGDVEDILSNEDTTQTIAYQMSDVNHYIEYYKRMGNYVAFGLFLVLLGAGLPAIMSTFDMSILGVLLLLVIVASGVGLMVFGGMNISNYEESFDVKGIAASLTHTDKTDINDRYLKYKQRNMFKIPLGVVLCVLSPIALIFFALMEQEDNIVQYGLAVLFVFIAIALYLFTTYGMEGTPYQKLLLIGDYTYNNQKADEEVTGYDGAYWLLVTAIYLIWSFYSGEWRYTWIIWLVASAIWAIISQFVKNRRRR